MLSANSNPIAQILEQEIMSPKELEESLETLIKEEIQDKIATKIAEQLAAKINLSDVTDSTHHL